MICNIAAYKFVEIPEDSLTQIQSQLKCEGQRHALKGTILVSTEGINLFLVGLSENIEKFQHHLAEYNFFKEMPYKYSYSDFWSFKKLVVKIKKEIITFKVKDINPSRNPAPYIAPQELKTWFENNQEMVILDARNDFEVALGTFKNAIHLNIKNFRDFPQAIKELPADMKNKAVVTFCTGGIRCEKAALFLMANGFNNVYQLQGGILNYFEQCQDAYFDGQCFVFDDRVALNGKMESLALYPLPQEGEG